jgi:hypothetical protein
MDMLLFVPTVSFILLQAALFSLGLLVLQQLLGIGL